jgi:hypothetical protein
MFGGRFGVSKTDAKDDLCGTLADFSSNKSASANRKKRFYTNRLPKNEEIGRSNLVGTVPLKVHKIEIFLASILKFVLFLY